MPPPKAIRISEIPYWIRHNYNMDVSPTRQTIYNWCAKGKNGVKLKTIKKLGKLYTYDRWLHDFINTL